MSLAPDQIARRWASIAIARRGRPLTAAVLLVLVAVLAFAEAPGVARLRHAGFDAYQRLLPRVRDKAPVVIIEIDEKSLARHGQWPWPRNLIARLVERVQAAGPAVIGLDMIFPEPDRMSAGLLADSLPGLDVDTVARLKALPGNDERLAGALASARVVLGVAGYGGAHLPAGAQRYSYFVPARQRGGEAAMHVSGHGVAIPNLPVLEHAASGHALLSADLEGGRVRRVPLVSLVGEVLAPSMSIELLRVAAGQPAFDIWVGPRGVQAVGVGAVAVPTQRDGRVWVHFTQHDPARFVSAADVLDGKVDAERIRGHLALVGVTGLAVTDYVTTPLDERIPGVEVHANLMENIFDQRVLRRPDWGVAVEAIALAAAGILLIVVMPASRVFLWPALLGAVLVALFGGGVAAYRYGPLLLDAVWPTLGTLVVFVVMIATLFAESLMQRRRLRERLVLERESKARLAGELDAARRIQMGILPQAADAFRGERRFSVYAYLEPAREVGGDVYDFFMLDADRLFFMIGDVSGKGLPASMLMAVSKALCKCISARHPANVAETLSEASREIGRENPEQFFVTLVAGVLDAHRGELRLANAGHDAPWLLRRSGVERLAQDGGPPLCTIENYPYREAVYQLAPGDLLCMVTDGITEAMNPQGELYGTARLGALLETIVRGPGELAPERVGAAILEAVRRFRGDAEPADDLAILAVCWGGREPQPAIERGA